MFRILVADDDDGFLTFAKTVLREGGYEVTVASNGPQALGLAENHGPFDLFVLDLLMPHMTGEDVARRLRLRDPVAKVLYCRSFSAQLFGEQAIAWGDEAVIDKPASRTGLLEAVSLLLFGDLYGPTSAADRIRHP